MPTDLKAVHDRPQAILTGPSAGSDSYDAADVLDAYETDHNVTFAALDNDALAAVREAYVGVIENDHDGLSLAHALEDLLGLGD